MTSDPMSRYFDAAGFYRAFLRPFIFGLVEPERAHRLALGALARLGPRASMLGGAVPQDERLRVRAFGLDFANPLGVAAGLDKDGVALQAWAALGFGAVEVGTVTPRPQSGHAPPRLFRLPADRALVNRMGFNSLGAGAVARHLARRPAGLIVGVSVGRNRHTVSETADYASVTSCLAPLADYVVVNVSSPNTEGLRALQAASRLEPLLETVRAGAAGRPLLVKIAPDLSPAEVDAVVATACGAGCAGIVAVNTTVARDGLKSPRTPREGGLSGAPLRRRATEIVRRVHAAAGGRAVIVGVGGIDSTDAAVERLAAGASLIQLYTGLVYEGPGLAGRILRGLLRHVERARLRSVAEIAPQRA
jgi:dihydroorotate dehydrogenase